jgi:hypothetical protein
MELSAFPQQREEGGLGQQFEEAAAVHQTVRQQDAEELRAIVNRGESLRSLNAHPGWVAFLEEVRRGETELMTALRVAQNIETVRYVQAQLASIARILAVVPAGVTQGEEAGRKLRIEEI